MHSKAFLASCASDPPLTTNKSKINSRINQGAIEDFPETDRARSPHDGCKELALTIMKINRCETGSLRKRRLIDSARANKYARPSENFFDSILKHRLDRVLSRNSRASHFPPEHETKTSENFFSVVARKIYAVRFIPVCLTSSRSRSSSQHYRNN
jgi:hypothetical protein